LDYVARHRAAGAKRLFPKLTDYRGRCTKNLSRWWGRCQDKYVSDAPEKVFHSFRHTFIDAMCAGIPKEFQIALVGHAAADGGNGRAQDDTSTRNSLDCSSSGISMISSRNSVPALARSA
jgi:hypothetical protein